MGFSLQKLSGLKVEESIKVNLYIEPDFMTNKEVHDSLSKQIAETKQDISKQIEKGGRISRQLWGLGQFLREISRWGGSII